MKILFYNHTGQVSGAERVLLMILAGLDRRRFVPLVLCPAKGELMNLAQDLGSTTVSIQTLRGRFSLRADRLVHYLGSFFCVIRAARQVIKRESPDLIHANGIRAGLVMSTASMGMGLPIIWHVHDLLPPHLLSVGIRLYAAAFQRNHIVAVSKAAADRFAGALPEFLRRRLRIASLYNAVDLNRFCPDAKKRSQARRELNLANSQLAIGIIGQLTPRKGHLQLIQAFTEVAHDLPEAVLIIVGQALFNRDADYAAILIDQARKSGIGDRIRFLGKREDVPDIMRALDLLVMNSSVEAFGLTIIEAMASGTPVLATAIDGINEIVRPGEDGWLIPCSNPAVLAEALRRLLLDVGLREELADRARQEVSRRFSADKFSGEIESLWTSVFATARPSRMQALSLRTELRVD